MNRLSRYLALGLVLAFAAACSDQGPAPVVIAPRVADGVITCQATVATQVVTCDSQLQSSAGMALNVTLGGANGGAGAYVKLTSSGTAYSGTSFTTTVTVQNLTAQPMGTDGTATDANGIRVYFVSGPTATGGTGAITVTGDGVGNLTGAGQPYYQFNGPLASGATSTSKAWTFVVPATVTTFTFGVLVSAKLPDDNGVLHWSVVTPPAGVTSTDFDEIAQANGELWAVGANGKIIHYTDAAGWLEQASGKTQTLHSVDMHGTNPVVGVAVGASGTILYYNGTTWSDHSSGSAELLSVSRVGGDVSPLWVACGLGGVIYTASDGQTWSQATSNTGVDLIVCGGPSTSDIYAAGGTVATPAFITHYNGTTWSSTGYTSTGTQIFRTAVGCGASGTTDIYVAGDGGSVQHAVSPFTTFTALTSGTTENIYGMTNPANSCNDLYLVGSNAMITHYNGTSWSAQNSGLTVTNFNDIEVRTKNDGSFLDAWVVGNTGTILHGTR